MVHMLSYYIVTTLLQCSKQNIFISVLGIYRNKKNCYNIAIMLWQCNMITWQCCKQNIFISVYTKYRNKNIIVGMFQEIVML